MTYELYADPEGIKRAGRGFHDGAGDLRRIHTRLDGALKAEGKCWGADETGKAFEQNYLEGCNNVLKAFGELAKGLEEVRKGVDQMADQYKAAEENSTIRRA
jgi:hypothetical protein